MRKIIKSIKKKKSLCHSTLCEDRDGEGSFHKVGKFNIVLSQQDTSCPLGQAANNSCEWDPTQSSRSSEDSMRFVCDFSLVAL